MERILFARTIVYTRIAEAYFFPIKGLKSQNLEPTYGAPLALAVWECQRQGGVPQVHLVPIEVGPRSAVQPKGSRDREDKGS